MNHAIRFTARLFNIKSRTFSQSLIKRVDFSADVTAQK
jgi:hypothetical protein